jgi:hypothetical protein
LPVAHGLTNIYISHRQIEHMKAHRDESSFIVLLFGFDGELRDEWEYLDLEQLLRDFELLPIKFNLKPRLLADATKRRLCRPLGQA